MPWPFRLRRQTAPAPELEPVPDGYLPALSASALLQSPHRQRLLAQLHQHSALPPSLFELYYLGPVQRYAALVQQLPASEAHHHAYPGGLLDHGLELAVCALRLRQAHLLPRGGAPEDQAAQADAWSAAIAYGALLHDVGKIAVDLEVQQLDGRPWQPWHGPLRQAYRFAYRTPRDYRLHAAVGGLLLPQVLAPASLDWLSGFPALWGSLLYALAGHYAHAGALGELIRQADRVSTAQNLGGNPQKALQAPPRSLQHHLITGLRHLLRHELKLNQPGAAGWLTDEALWLVSKTVTDKLRAWLLAQSIDGVPGSNLALFDELQSHGLVEPTASGKAIWNATIEDGAWHQPLTLLKVAPALIWAPDERPASFSGHVRVETPAPAPEPVTAPIPEPITQDAPPPPAPGTARHSSPQEQSEPPAEVLDELLTLLVGPTESAPEGSPVPPATSPRPEAPTPDPGQAFLDWVRAGITSHALRVNDSEAKVHTVAGQAFLVTPGLFQRYCREREEQGVAATPTWRQLQRRFEALGRHRKRPDDLNIWTCTVQGPRRKGRTLKGYLVAPGTLFETVPPDNPFLRLEVPTGQD